MTLVKVISLVVSVNFIASFLVTVSLAQCDSGRYGENCTNTCSANCFGSDLQCDPVDGSCDQGCKAGYKPPLCVDECDKGFYGVNCTEICSNNCAGDATCDHVYGTCYHGCQLGYAAPLCNEEIVSTSPDESSDDSNQTSWILTCILSVLLVIAVVALVISWRHKLASLVSSITCCDSVGTLASRFRSSKTVRQDTETADDDDDGDGENNNYDEVTFKPANLRGPPPPVKPKPTASTVTVPDQSPQRQSGSDGVYSDVSPEYILPEVHRTHNSLPDRPISQKSDASNVYILPDLSQNQASGQDKLKPTDDVPSRTRSRDDVPDSSQSQDGDTDRPLSHDSVYEQPRSLTLTLDDIEQERPVEDEMPEYVGTQYDEDGPQCDYINSSSL